MPRCSKSQILLWTTWYQIKENMLKILVLDLVLGLVLVQALGSAKRFTPACPASNPATPSNKYYLGVKIASNKYYLGAQTTFADQIHWHQVLLWWTGFPFGS